jgi:hypothetical protein
MKSALTTKMVEIIYNNVHIDSAFENLVASLFLELIDEDFGNYGELSQNLTKVLNYSHHYLNASHRSLPNNVFIIVLYLNLFVVFILVNKSYSL